MKNIFFLAAGVAAGVFAAHKLQQTDKGRAFFESVDSRAREFTDAVKDGYSSRDRELRGE